MGSPQAHAAVGRSWTVSLILAAGLVAGWIGERVVDGNTARGVWSGLCVLLSVFLAGGLRLRRRAQAQGERRRIETALLWLQGLLVLALALYVLQSDLWAKVVGEGLQVGWPRLSGVLSALWPAVLALAAIPTLLAELSYAAMARAPAVEAARIREAMLSGLALGLALIFAFALQYVVTGRDAKADLAYFRVSRPGDATKNLAQSLDEKLEVYTFFAPASDVGALVDGYFDDLRAHAPMLTLIRMDHALEPVKAKDLGVTGNGTVLFKKGSKKESFWVGTEMEKSRGQLRSLDAEVQKRLLQVGKSRRTIYLTTGHGERTQQPLGGADQRPTIAELWRALQEQNFGVHTLSAAEGLAQEVPTDAAAVFILGPQKPFAPEEAAALERYGKKGGRLFIALDPESRGTFEELLLPLGLSFKAETLTNDRVFARVRREYSLADRQNIGTRSFSSHPSVTYVSRYQAPLLFLGAGAVEELPKHANDLSIDIAVRADHQTWNDLNHDFEYQSPPEVRKAWGLVAAVNRRGASNKTEEELRALVLGDSDGITDEVLAGVQGNQLLVMDGLKWLLGEEQLQGAVTSEADVPITRTRQQETIWFLLTTLVGPALVLGLGVVARRRVKVTQHSQEAKS